MGCTLPLYTLRGAPFRPSTQTRTAAHVLANARRSRDQPLINGFLLRVGVQAGTAGLEALRFTT